MWKLLEYAIKSTTRLSLPASRGSSCRSGLGLFAVAAGTSALAVVSAEPAASQGVQREKESSTAVIKESTSAVEGHDGSNGKDKPFSVYNRKGAPDN